MRPGQTRGRGTDKVSVLVALQDLRQNLSDQGSMGFSEDSSSSSLIFARPPSLSSSLMERTRTKSTLGMVLRGDSIERLLPGGPAFMAGLQRGDKIVSVDGVEAEGSTVSYSIEIELVPCATVLCCARLQQRGESYPSDGARDAAPLA
jgi:C-terminal processing protease CtpA/Prc